MSAPIHFGIQTPQEGILYDTIRDAWVMAEQAGYDSAWLDDHMYAVAMPPTQPQMECYTLMAALARDTKTLRFGTLVGCNSFRNPTLTAKLAVTVDQVSNGRFLFGYGAGWFRNEYLAYGYEYPSPGTRIDQMREALTIMKSLWTEKETTFEGKYYTVSKAKAEPKPVQSPYPPILIGGGGEKKTLRAVAEHANLWNHGGSPDEMKHKIDVLGEHCATVGRDIGEIQKTWFGTILIDTDEQRVTKRLESRARMFMAGRNQFEARTIWGTPDQCADKIQQYIDVGVTGFIGMFGKVDNHTGALTFAEHVIPQFRT